MLYTDIFHKLLSSVFHNAVVGVHGKKARYIHATVVHNLLRDLFHMRKQLPHPPSFGMGHQSVYLVLYVAITQTILKLRCMLVI